MTAAWFSHSIIHQQVCPYTDMRLLTCFRALWSYTWVSLLSTKPEENSEVADCHRHKRTQLIVLQSSINVSCLHWCEEVRKLFLGNKFKECAESWRTGIHRNKVMQTRSPQSIKALKMCNLGKCKLTKASTIPSFGFSLPSCRAAG